MREHQTFLRALALLLCFFVALLGVQVAVKWMERALYPKRYVESVQHYAQEYGVEENIIYAIIRTESGFDETARSDVNALGLMQITEETFDWIKMKIAPQEAVVFDDLETPEVNLRFGTYYLSVCLARYGGDLKTAAAAYHSGMGTVDALLEDSSYTQDGMRLHLFPYAQMSNYVQKVERNYGRYETLHGK